MGHHFSHSFALFPLMLLLACGAEKASLTPTGPLPRAIERRHDYSSTWVYAVGEVDSPAKTDCLKAFGFIDGEADCLGKACQRGLDLVKDYEFACKKTASSSERARVAEHRTAFLSRVTEPLTPCLEKVDAWLAEGCGENGACESRVQRWATQCTQSTQSKLVVFLLERLIENSLTEPRRVKLDARSCSEFGKKLDEAATCSKPFDCEDALPRVDEYLIRCAQGKRKAVPLAAALSIVRIRLGAEKPVEPIALTDEKVGALTVPGTLPLVDRSGVVYRVCDEAATELKSYLEQRRSCKDGTVTLLRALSTPEGKELTFLTVPHDSDQQFSSAFPQLWVVGEADSRAQIALAAFADAMHSLPELALADFAGAIAKVNQAFATVPPNLRQSGKLREALAPHDAALTPLFEIIADSKVRVAGPRMSESELLAYMRRTETLVFADMAKSGSLEIGATIELSELLTKEALPTAFAAYSKKLEKLRKRVEKRKPGVEPDVAQARTTIAQESRACSTARGEFTEHQKQFEKCCAAPSGCEPAQRKKLVDALETAKTAWGEARAREIIAKLSAAQPIAPSAVCSNL